MQQDQSPAETQPPAPPGASSSPPPPPPPPAAAAAAAAVDAVIPAEEQHEGGGGRKPDDARPTATAPMAETINEASSPPPSSSSSPPVETAEAEAAKTDQPPPPPEAEAEASSEAKATNDTDQDAAAAATQQLLLGELESIQVMVRVRPLLEAEVIRGARTAVECTPAAGSRRRASSSASTGISGGGSSSASNQSEAGTGTAAEPSLGISGSEGSSTSGSGGADTNPRGGYVSVRSHPRRSIRCTYDYVFGPESTQQQVYEQVQGCVTRVLEAGYNGTIMAYGQTGSGKTHSMFGSQGTGNTIDRTRHAYTQPQQLPEDAGIIPRAVNDIFAAMRRRQAAGLPEVAVYCSFVQIYNEQLFDMLRDGGRDNPLVIHEDSNRDIYVEGLSEFRVRNVGECLALLRIGEENRAIRETHMNQASSRSHSIFQLVLEQELSPDDDRLRLIQEQSAEPLIPAQGDCILRSKLNLVDLAGSEKWDTRQDIGGQHAQELANINSSLFTLGRCIAALCAKGGPPTHVPYRESKLTRLIQDSLGGNTKTYLIATLSPTRDCAEESISTLKFADRAKQVMTYLRPNERPVVDQALLERLQREVVQLRAMVLKLREARVLKDEEGRAAAALEARVGELEGRLEEEQAESNRLREALEDAVAAREEALSRLQHQHQRQHQHKHQHRSRSPRPAPAAPAAEVGALQQKLAEAEGLNARFVGVLTRFFAFELEESELRQAVADVVPNVDDFIGGRAAPRRQGQPASSPVPSAVASSPPHTPPRSLSQSVTVDTSRSHDPQHHQPIAVRPVHQHQLQHHQQGQACCHHPRCAVNLVEAERAYSPPPPARRSPPPSPLLSAIPPPVSPRERRHERWLDREERAARHGPPSLGTTSPTPSSLGPPTPPRNRADAPPTASVAAAATRDQHLHELGPGGGGSPMTYRIRGATPAMEFQQQQQQQPPAQQPGGVASLVPYSREEEEQRLIHQLTRARKRLHRHIQLQEWLVRKEQRELEAMEQEEAERRLLFQARREADLRFREHARKQKKKLEAYYANLREEAGAAGPTTGDGGSVVAPSPTPSSLSSRAPR